jgi:hypothetical protein
MTQLNIRLGPRIDHPTLGVVAEHLKDALVAAGYDQQAWFAVPTGFALVTRLEQTDDRGSPLAGDSRWSIDTLRMSRFSVEEFLSALFSQPHGYFRVLVFIVSAVPFTQSQPITRDEAIAWMSRGADRLPVEISSLLYTPEHACSALIYEFEIQDKQPMFRTPGRLTATRHLLATNLLSRF